MRFTIVSVCLAATLVALGRADAQVNDVGTPQTPNEREYWEDRRFGADEFWRNYARWYGDAGIRTYGDQSPSVFGVRPYHERLAYPDADAGYENPRLRGYNPRLRGMDPRRPPYTVRPYTAHERRLIEENDYLSPDSFEPMDEDVSRWPAYYRDYHDFYHQDAVYPSRGYFWPASGLAPQPTTRYWR